MLFDIDGNGSAGAFSDGVLILRYMIALRSLALIGGAVALDALRETAADIEAYLGQVIDRFDIDDNGIVGAFSDGILIARFLTGLRGEALIDGAVADDANRTTEEEIVAYLEELANSTLGFVDPLEVRTIEENNDLDVELAIERASDLSRYTEEELDSVEELVIEEIETEPDAPTPDSSSRLELLGFRRSRRLRNRPNTYIVELPKDDIIRDGSSLIEQLDSIDEIEYYYPLVKIEPVPDYIPNDPFFEDQWHLLNTGQMDGTAGVDANITAAWDIPNPRNPSETVRGRDVVIGIVDDGLDITHPDIAARYRNDLSNDFLEKDGDPSPNLPRNHGTLVAGIAAANGDDGIGVTGAAPQSSIAALRLLGSGYSEDLISEALGHENQEIDIYQNSWSPREKRLDLRGPNPLALTALQTGVDSGRDGKGSIYVFSAGNNRESVVLTRSGDDNVNYNGYANSRYTIAVGAIDHNGVHAPYSEPGAPLLISAPSSERVGADVGVGVTTTGFVVPESDENDYTNRFGGTSAAAPLVSGVIALMLEANPELGWRDVQHIIVETAAQNDPSNPDWVINGAGKHVNHFYGFGLIDAEAAVLAAIDWTPVAPEIVITEEFTGGLAVPDNNPVGVSTAVTVNSDIQVEWAEVVFDATHPRRGDWEIVLVSPDGTESILAERRPDFSADIDWTFTSARHWGESSVGEWTLRVSDLNSGETGTLEEAELRLYGTVNEVVEAPNQPPIATDDVASTPENSPVRIEVLNNDLDPDGDRLALTGENTISLNGGTIIRDTNGTFDDLSDDSLVYRPAVNFTGTDSFRYTLSDGNGGTDSATVTVTVVRPNRSPIAEDDVDSTEENTTVRIEVLNNDLDPDDDRLFLTGENTISLNGGTIVRDTNGTFDDLSDDSLVYNPPVNFTGTDSFRYTISDGNGGTDDATVTVTVERANQAPIAVNDVASIPENSSATIAVLANDLDPDGDPILVTGVGSSGNGSVSIGNNQVIYTPDADFAGNDSFRYTISDGELTDAATVTVTVEPVNEAPIAARDANITRAWDIQVPGNPSQTVRGRGVVIGVVDDGLQFTHPDIADRYRPDLSNDFLDNDRDPSPNSPDENHGTKVARVAAGDGDNGMGVTGAAPGAFIAGIRLLGIDAATTVQIADALSWQNQEIDIYQNGWSPTNRLDLAPVARLTLTALQDGVNNGRGGKGNIYVFSAGNNGQESFLDGFSGRDNVNYNGYANSRYTVAVGAIDDNGVHASYSEPGAPLLVSAPSAARITTTELENNFGGTSAAAALVSGIIALMLEANPELGWRDVQHILVETAVQNDPSNPDWVINGAGFHVNHLNGFGAIDAEAAVQRAIEWTPVEPELIITNEFTGDSDIPDNDPAGVETTVTFNADLKVEWAEVVFEATHPRRGDLEVVLISPDGTESILAEQRDDFNADIDWRFTSARHWGESSVGEWTLRVSDLSSGETGTLDFAELRLYGTANADILTGTPGIPDTFSLSSSQTVAIEGFVDGEDVLEVSGGLTFSDLNVTAGTGSSIGNTLIAIESSNQVIAELIGVQSVSIAQQDFIFV